MNDVNHQAGFVSSDAVERIELEVAGMTCSGCSGRVQRALSAEPGVREASVDLAAGTASVSYHPHQTNPGSLVEVVRRTGYRAEPRQAAAEDEGGV